MFPCGILQKYVSATWWMVGRGTYVVCRHSRFVLIFYFNIPLCVCTHSPSIPCCLETAQQKPGEASSALPQILNGSWSRKCGYRRPSGLSRVKTSTSALAWFVRRGGETGEEPLTQRAARHTRNVFTLISQTRHIASGKRALHLNPNRAWWSGVLSVMLTFCGAVRLYGRLDLKGRMERNRTCVRGRSDKDILVLCEVFQGLCSDNSWCSSDCVRVPLYSDTSSHWQ